jgi:hypothetical protein
LRDRGRQPTMSVVFRRRVDHAVERDDVNAIMTFLMEMDAKLDESF